jgi:hypothetical protein
LSRVEGEAIGTNRLRRVAIFTPKLAAAAD